MTKKDKRLAKIRNNPRNVRFEDIQTVLLDFGFIVRQAKKGSSHFVFVAVIQGQSFRVNIPHHRPHIKQTYKKQAMAEIDKIIELEKDSDND